jgi:hypothetical protein
VSDPVIKTLRQKQLAEDEFFRAHNDRVGRQDEILRLMNSLLPVLARETDLTPLEVVERAHGLAAAFVDHRWAQGQSLDQEWRELMKAWNEKKGSTP